MEFDFTICVKPGQSHEHADHLLRITSGEAPTGIDDELPDAVLFQVDIAPQWAKPILQVLSLEVFHAKTNINESRDLLKTSKKYLLNLGNLYKQGLDKVLKMCLDNSENEAIIKESHEGLCGSHFLIEQML